MSYNRYTSICHHRNANYQIDYQGSPETCFRDFENWCLKNDIEWATLIHETTGTPVARYSKANPLELVGSKGSTALAEYQACCAGDEDPDPVERLRFFCSQAMSGQDWLDVDAFFDAVVLERDALQENLVACDARWAEMYRIKAEQIVALRAAVEEAIAQRVAFWRNEDLDGDYNQQPDAYIINLDKYAFRWAKVLAELFTPRSLERGECQKEFLMKQAVNNPALKGEACSLSLIDQIQDYSQR